MLDGWMKLIQLMTAEAQSIVSLVENHARNSQGGLCFKACSVAPLAPLQPTYSVDLAVNTAISTVEWRLPFRRVCCAILYSSAELM